ncbi:hypothetical protein K439DRAFT_1615792 [Ramaria rubella]|nr:hypothetical protein K439DRAFT_1615792 [Ramaria rubella]
MDYSSAIEHATLQELSGGSIGSSASPTVDMGEVWEPVDSILEDVGDWIMVDDEELQTVYGDLADGMREIHYHHFIQRPQDGRSRRDRVQLQNEAWTLLYPALMAAHLQWAHLGPPNIPQHIPSHPIVTVIDIFESCDIPINDVSLNVTMARHGYIGTAPIHPSTGISVKALELLQVLTAQCPQMSLQAFVKSLCRLHQVAYCPILCNQLSMAFDVYLEIRQVVDRCINMELQRDTPKWRLQNACAPCTYVLQNEPTLEFYMLVAMDGNESLKQVKRVWHERNAHGVMVQCENIEREDKRTIMSYMYLDQEAVNIFRHEVKCRKDPDTGMQHSLEGGTTPMPVHYVFAANTKEGRLINGVEKPNLCIKRWANLMDESTKKQLAIFHETGVFLAVCCHGNALAMCDMVQSGELAKYGLAVTNELLDTFGPQLMFRSFHGHAHCHLCQLDLHPLYIRGSGLEDFETCEHVFSHSNALASSTRHATAFHSRQLIHQWFEAWNQEKYTECSKFILDHYTQALANIASLPHSLADSMKVLNILSEQTFGMWHQAKHNYLAGLKHELPIDVLHIDDKWAQASSQWLGADLSDIQGPGAYQCAAVSSWKLEAAHARALETLLTLQKAIQDLETKLEIEVRWVPTSPEWIATQSLIDTCKYRCALDHLEGLVVARLFELTKAHQPGTGYKLCKHIGKALKACSEAIHTAAALEVQTVLDYVYLAQFDLLQESRALLPDLPWSQAPEREAVLAYFKCQRSREDILRLNVEVRHLWTWMDDEEVWMLLHIQRLEQENPALAFQVHRQQLYKLASLPGFCGDVTRGVCPGQSSPTSSTHVDGLDRRETVDVDELDKENEDTLEALEHTMRALNFDE